MEYFIQSELENMFCLVFIESVWDIYKFSKIDWSIQPFRHFNIF